MKSFFTNFVGIVIAILRNPFKRSTLPRSKQPGRQAYVTAVEEPEEEGSIELGSKFLWVFWGALGLTIISLAVALWLSDQTELSEQQKELFETCSTTWKMGFGAILGLIGGKAT